MTQQKSKKSTANFDWHGEVMELAGYYFPFRPIIQIQEVTYKGLRMGFKVYIDGKKYPKEYGCHYSYMTPFHAVQSAIKNQ